MTRVLVVGGTGFLGAYVVRELVERGATVCVFHRGETEADLPDATVHVHGEFASFSDYVPELRAFSPQVVLDVVPFHAKGGHGVAHFVGVADRAVVVTSGDVYRAFARLWGSEPGPPDAIPLTEDSPLREQPSPDLGSEIDYDNVEVERAVGRLSLPTTVLRLPAIFGPRDPFHRLFRYVKRMDDGRPAIILDERIAGWRFSRGYVVNVAAAVALATLSKRAAGRAYNVAPLQPDTETQWVRRIARVHGWDGQILVAASLMLPEQLRVQFNTEQDLVLDSTRLRDELSYSEPVTLNDALADTIAWERQNPPADLASNTFDYEAEDEILAAQIGRTPPGRLP
jgi:nucleoside-diphosphate-sugar epimerase